MSGRSMYPSLLNDTTRNLHCTALMNDSNASLNMRLELKSLFRSRQSILLQATPYTSGLSQVTSDSQTW